MSFVPGVRGQQVIIPAFRFDGVTISDPKLILPQAAPRSALWFANSSDTAMYFEMGPARAHATLTSGVVTSVTIDNAGFNYTLPPRVLFFGGSNKGNGLNLGLGMPGADAPANPAVAHCTLSSDGYADGLNKVASVVIDNGGSGYAIAPYVYLMNDPNDPYGCADPGAGGGSGVLLYPGQSVDHGAHNVVATETLAVYCTSASKAYFCQIKT